MTGRRGVALAVALAGVLGLLAAMPLVATPTVRRVAANTEHTIHDHAVWPGRGILLLAGPLPPAGEKDPPDPPEEHEAEDVATLPRRLLVLEGLPDAPRLRELRSDLPAAARSLAWVGGALWVGEPGKLHRLRAEGTATELAPPRLLLDDPAVSLRTALDRGWLDAERGELAVVDVGELRRYRLEGDRLELRERRPLPLGAERQSGALVLSTPPVTLLRDGLIAVGPEAAGSDRLRVLLLREGEEAIEAWARLPAAETVVDSRVVELDDRPALVVVVRSADKLGLFERARVRVIGLAADRSRSGRRPMLAVDTASRPWQAVETRLADADGDGDGDLVVLHEDGMSGDALLIDAYLGDGRGGLRPSQLVSDKVKLEDSAWHYGDDLDGDGRPDVVLRTRDRLQVVVGEPGKKRLLARRPWLDVALAASEVEPTTTVYIHGGPDTGAGYTFVRPDSRPYLVDVDGDGRLEILLRMRAENGTDGVLWVSPPAD